jgi:hypothetical protein
MDVTVGIPTFNRAGMLAGAIESVLSQTFTSFRLVISDNASSDATPELVRSFRDERIEYVRSDRNIGALANLNRLIDLADTEFLVLLPDDDLLYPGHLQASVGLLRRSAALGLTHTGFDLIDANSRLLGSISPLTTRASTMIEPRHRALERLMVSTWPACSASVMYRTRAIVEADGLREQDGPFGDLQLWMRIALNWDFGYVAKTLAGFRAHAASASSRIGAQQGVSADGNELVLALARTRFERRMTFLQEAPMERETMTSLRALAALQLLVEQASLGLPRREVASRLAGLVADYPRIAFRSALWRLILAELGARRVRSMLRAASARR